VEPRRDLDAIRAQLSRMAARIRRELGRSTTGALGELSAYDNHPAEAASTTFGRELDVTVVRALEHRRKEVERALEKLREGSYGTCDRCHRAIDPARLEVRPESILCQRCAEVEEAWRLGRPDGEEIPLPFGGIRGRRPVEATGEDMWQEVAQSGTSDTPQDTPPAVDYQETFVDFGEPIGSVEAVEGVVDETGEALLDADWARPLRQGRSTAREDEGGPPTRAGHAKPG